MSVSLYLPPESGIENFDQLGQIVSVIPVHSDDIGTLKIVGAASNSPDGGTIFDIYNWQLKEGTHGRIYVEGAYTQFARKALLDLLAPHGGKIEKNSNGAHSEKRNAEQTSETSAETSSSSFSIMFHGYNRTPEDLVGDIASRVSPDIAAKVKAEFDPGRAEVEQKGRKTVITFFSPNLHEIMGEVSDVVTTLLGGRIVSNSKGRQQKVSAPLKAPALERVN